MTRIPERRNNAPRLVSVVVPCRNERAHIEEFLECLRRQVLPEGAAWEALVAEGRSADGSRFVLEREARRDPRIRVIDNPQGIVSTGLNRAIRQSRGEVIVRMDVHTRYAPDYIARCLAVLEETGADNVGGPVRTRARGAVQQAIAAAFHSPWFAGGGKSHDVAYEGEADTVAYGCWRREALDRAGLFDEELVRSQDSELNLRIRRRGGRVWQSPAIRSWYFPRSSLAGLARQHFQYGYWKCRLVRKSRAVPAWRQLVPPAFVAALVLLASLAFFFAAAAHCLAGALAAYGFVVLAASVESAGRAGGWRARVLLPAVFVQVHVCWGAGFWRALFDAVLRRGRHCQAPRRESPTPASAQRPASPAASF